MNNFNFWLGDIDNFNVMRSLAREQPNFSVFSLNAQRICHRRKFARFSSYIESFNVKPLVLGITETWFLSSETGELEYDRRPIRFYDLEDYKSTFSSRDVHSAGIALYVHNDATFELIDKGNGVVSFIHGRISIMNDSSGDELYITLVYMPRVADYQSLLGLLETLFTRIPKGKRHIVMGDFNVDVSVSGTISLAYLDLLTSYGYTVTNDKVTRPSSNSIIDHVVINFDGVVNNTVANNLSDHSGVFSSFNSALPTGNTQTQHSQRKDVNINRLRESLRFAYSDLSVFDNLGAEDSLTQFVQILNHCIENNSRTMRVCKIKVNSKAWIDEGIVRLSGQKRRLLRRLGLGQHDSVLMTRVKELTQEIAIKKRSAKSRYIRDQFVRGASGSRACWEALNNVLGRDVNHVTPERLLVDGGRLVTGAQSVAEELNRAFVGCDVSPPQVSQSFVQSGARWNQNSMVLLGVLDVEVESLLRALDVRKSTGYDGISTYVLKNCASEISSALALCINRALEDGIYPDFLKVARVTPIFKGGSKELTTNYRPISVLSALNKIYESVLASKLKSFFKSHNLIYDHQYGFREKSGTSTAALEAMDFVLSNLDKKDYGVVSALFIDLRKAFDSVNHDILLKKLYKYGVRGTTHSIVSSYLGNRSQFVSVSGESSAKRVVKRGVPQGSVLGPLLFLVFLNDVAQLPLFGKIFLYADDACLMYPGVDDLANCVKMNEDLEMLSQYLSRNELQLNVAKTKYMHLRSSRKRLQGCGNVHYCGESVQEVQEFCYLGLWLDANLTWRRHVQYLCTKLARLVGVFFRVWVEIPLYALKRLYYALAHSRLMYMVTIWANASLECLNRLQTLQNRLLKIMYRLPILTPTLSLYERSGTLPIKGMQIYSTCKFIRESISNSTYHTLTFTGRPGTQ